MVVFTCIAVAVTEVVHFYMCTCFKSNGENAGVDIIWHKGK